MYKILITDYVNGKQSVYPESFPYYLEAVDALEQLGFTFIREKEGEKYFERLPIYKFNKFYIKKGYGLCIKKNGFMTKITIFQKEPNGFVISGNLKKIIQFTTFKEKRVFVPADEEELDYDQLSIKREITNMVLDNIPRLEMTDEKKNEDTF
jgi:hypothetical protein